jgi:hypothetical protein
VKVRRQEHFNFEPDDDEPDWAANDELGNVFWVAE